LVVPKNARSARSAVENFQYLSGRRDVRAVALLLVFREVQEDLDDARAVAMQVVFEGVDVLVALTPQFLSGR